MASLRSPALMYPMGRIGQLSSLIIPSKEDGWWSHKTRASLQIIICGCQWWCEAQKYRPRLHASENGCSVTIGRSSNGRRMPPEMSARQRIIDGAVQATMPSDANTPNAANRAKSNGLRDYVISCLPTF